MLTPAQLNLGVRRMGQCKYAAALGIAGYIFVIPHLLSAVGLAKKLIPYLVCLGLALIALVAAVAYSEKRFLTRCPQCGKPFRQYDAQIAIATKHCGFCGHRVIAEADRA
jgi:hypothetical protein